MNQWDPGSSCRNSCQSNYEIPQTSRLHTSAPALYSLNFARSTLPPPRVYILKSIECSRRFEDADIYSNSKRLHSVATSLRSSFFLADIFRLIAPMRAATCSESEIEWLHDVAIDCQIPGGRGVMHQRSPFISEGTEDSNFCLLSTVHAEELMLKRLKLRIEQVNGVFR